MIETNQITWQPISQMPLIASMITASLNDTHQHLDTLARAKDRPPVLDDEIIDRVEQAHTEQMQCVEIYAQQIVRWRTEKPLADHADALDRMETENQQLRRVTADVLALAGELRKGSINRVLSMSDIEIALQTLRSAPVSGTH